MRASLKEMYREPLYRNSISLIVSSGSMALFGLIFWLVAARSLTTQEVGTITATIAAATLIVSLSRFGMDAALVRFLPQSLRRNDLYSTVVLTTLICALILTALFLVGLEFFSPALALLRNLPLALAFALYTATYAVYSIESIAVVGLRRGELYLIQNIILGLRVPILFFIASLGVLGALVSWDAALMISILFGAEILRRHSISHKLKIDVEVLKRIFGFSIGNYSASLLATAPATVMPILIINTAGAQASAYFYIAYGVASLLLMIPDAVTTSLFVEGSHKMPLKEVSVKSLRLIMALLLPSLAFILLFGDKILLAFGPAYATQSLPILRLLALSSVFNAITWVYVTVKKVQKKVRIVNYIYCTLAVFVIGGGYFALTRYGLLGLGYVWLLSNVAMCGVVIVAIVTKERWK